MSPKYIYIHKHEKFNLVIFVLSPIVCENVCTRKKKFFFSERNEYVGGNNVSVYVFLVKWFYFWHENWDAGKRPNRLCIILYTKLCGMFHIAISYSIQTILTMTIHSRLCESCARYKLYTFIGPNVTPHVCVCFCTFLFSNCSSISLKDYRECSGLRLSHAHHQKKISRLWCSQLILTHNRFKCLSYLF